MRLSGVANAGDQNHHHHMTTCSTIKEAIGRSISHNEIALVIVDDLRAALESIDNDENVSDFDHSTENNGDIDAWGTRLDREFRIRIRQS